MRFIQSHGGWAGAVEALTEFAATVGEVPTESETLALVEFTVDAPELSTPEHPKCYMLVLRMRSPDGVCVGEESLPFYPGVRRGVLPVALPRFEVLRAGMYSLEVHLGPASARLAYRIDVEQS